MTDLATLTTDGPTATLALNRPDARNACSIELLDAAHARLDDLGDASGVRVLTITGTGRAFCAGMDLKQVIIDESMGGSGDPGLPRRLLGSLGRFTLRLRALPCVTLAKVNGAAIGGGCGLACCCDIAVSHADAKLGFPEVDLGLCPAVVAPWVVRKLGAGRARRVLLMGGVMSGAEALGAGIVDQLAPDRDALDTLAHDVATRLAKGGPHALAATKRLLNELDGSLDADLIERGADLSASVLARADAQEILAARLR